MIYCKRKVFTFFNIIGGNKMKEFAKKLISIVLALLMVCSVLPFAAFAAATENLRAFAIFPYGYPAEEREQQDRFDESRIHYVE